PDILIKKDLSITDKDLKNNIVKNIQTIAETKVSNFLHSEKNNPYNIPMYILCQINWDLGFYGLKKGYVSGIRLGYNLSYFDIEVEFSEDLFKKSILIADEIYKYMVMDDELFIKEMSKSLEDFLLLYRNLNFSQMDYVEKEIKAQDADEYILDLLKYEKLRGLSNAIKKEIDALSEKLKDYYDADYKKNLILIKEGKEKIPAMSLNMVEVAGFNEADFKYDHPDLYNKYRNPKLKSYVRLDIKKELKEYLENDERYYKELKKTIDKYLDSIIKEYQKTNK
ncbi:MAG: hypothetical protein NC918_06100, partial [Candidatus Omnitrophica bacterium]|nr:hypothetical protein [Candidatus Omnitrophota bacterium]